MRIEARFPQQGIEGNVQLLDAQGGALEEVYDKDGNPIAVGGFVYQPFFYRADAKPTSLFLQSQDSNGRVLSRSLLIASGLTGKLTLMDRSRHVPPACENRKAKTPAAVVAPEEDEDDDLPELPKKGHK